MNIPIKSGQAANRAAYTKKQLERETWQKLVVKVIRWKNGLFEGGVVQITDKISHREWNTYYRGILRINTTSAKQTVVETLKQTREFITKHGGFQEE